MDEASVSSKSIKFSRLDQQLNQFGFWCSVVALASLIISLFIPLDIPSGYAAEQADRVAWLNDNRGAFIFGWLNQIVAMLSLSGVFFAMTWVIAITHPLRAMVAAMVVLISVVAFIIPKFMAIWTIPLLAEAIALGDLGANLAEQLLLLLNVSIPFSLYTSFDYLGFWLYGVFGLLVAGPLYGGLMSTKIAAATVGVFGVLYQLCLAALLLGLIEAVEIETYFLSMSMLLMLMIVSTTFSFRQSYLISKASG